MERGEDTARDDVRDADDSGHARVAGQQSLGLPVAGLAIEGAAGNESGVDGQPVRRVGAGEAVEACAGRGVVRLGGADERDPAMAEREQVVRHRERAALVVVLDDGGGYVGADRRAAAEHQAGSDPLQRPGDLCHPLEVFRRTETTADQHDCLGLLLAHQFDEFELAIGVAVMGADQTDPALGGGLLLDALPDVGEQRTDEVADDERDRPRRAADQGTGLRVDHEVEVLHGPEDPFPGRGADRVVPGEHPRDRRGAHARSRGDVLHRRTASEAHSCHAPTLLSARKFRPGLALTPCRKR